MEQELGIPFDDGAEDSDNEVDQDLPDDKGEEDDATNEDGGNLDALEEEELEAVETNESATILVDEAGEIMAIRKAELNLDAGAEEMRGDEFVCRNCFLLLKKVQLADPGNMFCADCS